VPVDEYPAPEVEERPAVGPDDLQRSGQAVPSRYDETSDIDDDLPPIENETAAKPVIDQEVLDELPSEDESAAESVIDLALLKELQGENEHAEDLPDQNEVDLNTGFGLSVEMPPEDQTAGEIETDSDTGTDPDPAGGNGLLAAASSLYETDNFNSKDDEAEFPDILQGELRRMEKAGKDIALLSVEWSLQGLPSDSLVKQASIFFKQGSRFFEKENRDGIYIIVPDCGLDEVFEKVKEFHRQARNENRAGLNAELLIGLSARSDRIVDAMHFLNEAERALAKARADTALPIVAFKVDPQKYKEFINKNKKTA
jgi:hypothetical protein